mmetsp:Transcript_31400/g.45946  ORF Transcript_31400/g.45946 Transcript_31400/m.45946 type:complete len:118 (+) Transcript_31400:904-1257(+)
MRCFSCRNERKMLLRNVKQDGKRDATNSYNSIGDTHYCIKIYNIRQYYVPYRRSNNKMKLFGKSVYYTIYIPKYPNKAVLMSVSQIINDEIECHESNIVKGMESVYLWHPYMMLQIQ